MAEPESGEGSYTLAGMLSVYSRNRWQGGALTWGNIKIIEV